MLIAATPIPDSVWLPPVLVLIFAVPIGAFLSLFAIVTSFLFHTVREAAPVMVLGFLAFAVNGGALLFLADSAYNHGRFLVVPLAAWMIALAAGGITYFRTMRVMQEGKRVRRVQIDEEISSFREDR